MAQPKFGAGQRVSVRSGGSSAPRGSYRIVAALPLEQGPQQYRVDDGEMFDRVMDEVKLEAMNYD